MSVSCSMLSIMYLLTLRFIFHTKANQKLKKQRGYLRMSRFAKISQHFKYLFKTLVDRKTILMRKKKKGKIFKKRSVKVKSFGRKKSDYKKSPAKTAELFN